MVVLAVLDLHGLAVDKSGAPLWWSVWHAGHQLGETDRRVRLVIHAQQEDFAVKLLNAAYREHLVHLLHVTSRSRVLIPGGARP